MLRTVKTIMIFTVALWGILGAIHNVIDWAGTTGAVAAVTSMATLGEGLQGWQATSNTLLIWAGALFIMLSKVAAGSLCTLGGVQMWRARATDNMAFKAAKQMALSGCAIAMIMLFGGFIVIAEGWFELWRSEVMREPVLGSAFRYGAMIMLIAIFVSTDDSA